MKLELHWKILIGMVLGAVLGIAVNWQWSTRVTELQSGLPAGVQQATIRDSSDTIQVSWIDELGEEHERIVDPTGNTPGGVMTVDDLAKTSPLAAELYERAPSRAKQIGKWCKRIGGLFLRMLQMVSVPLIIASLSTGILGMSGASRFKKMFSATLAYYVATSGLAILTGLAVTNIINPGLNTSLKLDVAQAQVHPATLTETLMQQVETMIPTNPFAAIANSAFLSVISFTLLFSIFTLKVGGEALVRMRQLADDSFQVMMLLTAAIIGLAPYGVFLLMIYVTATQGIAVFSALAWYMLAVASGLLFHALVTLPIIVWVLARRSPWALMKAMSPALLTAFSSASSNATLPLTINNIEKRAGVSNRTSSFVLPLGSTINMDGTALYEAVAVLFIGQLAFGANMDLTQQIAIALTALLASIGAAGIPHAGLVMMAIVLQAANLPIEYQGIILAVDRVLDMFRTSVNVWSDCCGTTVIDRLVPPATASLDGGP
ncbi:dicarboxylate/amino acid:cation symporter [Aureliella helgolandensis]|uniref:Proton glutamate symport protein n=1 Tax=Aureliella helgolandensis TaxID=2527968 RepID=A0A518G2K4_9BACT|nr:dicarboxylate/amino acid:cation symporter [Aureliella helgolandensis]QDV22831.1 Proton glutamate symport protein [Aureliella helgolandensis]